MASSKVGAHYTRISARYAESRPRYPALIKYLATICRRTECAWDCGTGNGQAAVSLAELFDRVIATDLSDGQIEKAAARPNITFRIASAEDSGVDAESADLVTAAHSFHWFDRDAFVAEVRRVARPGAILAAWCYQVPKVEPAIDQVTQDLYTSPRLESFWPDVKREVDAGYRDVKLPFEELQVPEFWAEEVFSLGRFESYLRTWEAVRKSKANREARAFVRDQFARLAAAWGPADRVRTVQWHLSVRAWTIRS